MSVSQKHKLQFLINVMCMQEALRALWQLSFPERELPGLVSEQWKDMGWQGANPSTDFRLIYYFSLFLCVYMSLSIGNISTVISNRFLVWLLSFNTRTWIQIIVRDTTVVFFQHIV